MLDFCFTIPYGLLLVVGGVIGYAKKGSTASLAGGAGTGLLLVLAGFLSLQAYHKRKNSYFALILETAKIELDRWDGKGDFGLWKRRMYAILVQQKVAKALSGEIKLPDSLTEDRKADMMDLAFSSLTLHFDDKVLREVSSEKSAAGIWSKLEQLYMTKSLQDRIYLKGKFFGFKMIESRTIGQNLDEFNRVILDLENIEIEIDDEDKAIVILNALPKSHSVFVETMKYARETLTFNDVQKALKSKEIDSKQSKDLAPNTGDNLLARGRSERRDPKHKFRNRSKSKDKKGKCFHCHKVGHYRRECPERHKHFEKPKDQGDLSMAEEECSDAEVLCVTNLKDNTCWVLDSGCSFHMSPNKCWFETFEDIDGGQVVLGNNKACQVRGIGSIRFKMHDGTEKLINNISYCCLANVGYDPEVSANFEDNACWYGCWDQFSHDWILSVQDCKWWQPHRSEI